MGFTINEEITTKLHYKDIALIAVAMGEYQRLYKETTDKETIDRMRNLVNRLGNEMADCPHKRKMGISLKEAIDKSEININDLEAENKKKKEDLLKEVAEKLDKLISINILTILQKPVNITFPIDGLYNYDKEISAMYTDFTIYFSAWSRSVSIKLSEKDWDWKGYGIKDEPIVNNDNKKSIFSFWKRK
jgi:hypothetical protein